MDNYSSAVAEDLYRRSGLLGWRPLLKHLRIDPTLVFIAAFRVTKARGKYSILGFLAYLVYRHHRVKYGLQIPIDASIGRALLMPHFGGIVVNSKALIGNNCTILQGVTIGSVASGPRAGAPTIESYVYIGPNAVVVGGINVGRGAVLAPGAFVNFDVPAGSLVIGNPGKIVKVRENSGTPEIKNPVDHLA